MISQQNCLRSRMLDCNGMFLSVLISFSPYVLLKSLPDHHPMSQLLTLLIHRNLNLTKCRFTSFCQLSLFFASEWLICLRYRRGSLFFHWSFCRTRRTEINTCQQVSTEMTFVSQDTRYSVPLGQKLSEYPGRSPLQKMPFQRRYRRGTKWT